LITDLEKVQIRATISWFQALNIYHKRKDSTLKVANIEMYSYYCISGSTTYLDKACGACTVMASFSYADQIKIT